MLVQVVFIILATFFAESEGVSAHGGIFGGKKRNKMPGLATATNRFLCPGCGNRKKEFTTTTGKATTDLSNAIKEKNNDEIHCMKGDKGERGDNGVPGKPGEQGPDGTCNREQVEAVVKPLQAKLEALFSSYTTEIARLRNEVRSIKSRFVHTLGSERNPAKSCKEIYEQEKYSQSGAYYLNMTMGGITRVYCYMEEDETCPAGSTLVLKIDGTKDTFKYSSPLWSNKEVFSAENGGTLFDSKETKLATYWGVPLTKICINMRKADHFEAETLVIKETSDSLFDIIAKGNYHATKGGREIWKTLLPGSQLQEGCYREGFNAHGVRPDSAGARIGVVASNESNCSAPDSFIGFGTEGGRCASDSRHISCGNEAGTCSVDTDEYIPAFGYIFVY